MRGPPPVLGSPVPAVRSRAWMGWALGLGLLWALLVYQLHVEWSINELYSYGWLVPFLAGYLVAEAWAGRPAPEGPRRRRGALAAGAILGVLWLPVRLTQEANPDWRLVSWAMALQVTALTLLAFYLAGGRAWLRHFFFPVAFFLVAVPWPTLVEQPLIQGLMRLVASVTMEVMNWVGVPAVARGNLIELPQGFVGVDEACSGVRSLQSVVMVGLFAGEFFRLGAARRLALVGVGVGLAVAMNLGRAVFLVSLAADQGAAAMVGWHDAVGYAVLAGAVLPLWGLAWRWRGRVLPLPSPAGRKANPLAVWVPVLAIGWLACAEVLTEIWYRSGEGMPAHQAALWRVSWPAPSPGFERVNLGERERAMLRANRVEAARWTDPLGRKWIGYFLRWEPGRNAAQLARLHRPEVCLPAVGAALVAEHDPVDVPLREGTVKFRHLEFSQQGQPVHVFYTLQEDRSPRALTPGEIEDFSAASRWRAVLAGRRHAGQQVFEVAIAGESKPAEAAAAFIESAREMIRP